MHILPKFPMTMPDWRTWIVLIMLIQEQGAESVPISGSTRSGMPIEGNVVAIENGRVLLKSPSGEAAVQWGMPLPEIARVALVDQALNGESLLAQLELIIPLLEAWDRPTLLRLLRAVRSAAGKGDWPTTYTWATRLLELKEEADLRADLLLLQAQALLGMGLVQRATTTGDSLKSMLDPMDYPAQFCALMAQLAQHAGNDREAKAWRFLPALQIPAQANLSPIGNEPADENQINP